MNDDIVLEFLEKLSKNLDNIKVDYDSDQVIFQEPGNPYKLYITKKVCILIKEKELKYMFMKMTRNYMNLMSMASKCIV